MSRHSTSVRNWAKELIEKGDATQILQQILTRYSNPHTISTTISNVRFHIIESNPLQKDILKSTIKDFFQTHRELLLQHKSEVQLVKNLLQMNARELEKTQKDAKFGHYTFIPEIDQFISQTIIPSAFPNWYHQFHAPAEVKEELFQISRSAESSARTRVVRIKDIKKLFEWLLNVNTTHSPPLHRLIACALLTGRRTIELQCTGRFTPLSEEDNNSKSLFACQFEGQVKKRETDETVINKYTIPLLLPFERVNELMNSFRSELQLPQCGVGPEDDEIRNTMNRKYASALRYQLHQIMDGILQGKYKIHDLRSMYVKFVYEYLFDEENCDLTFPGFAERVLGHSDELVSIHYNRIRTKGSECEFIEQMYANVPKFQV